MQGPRTPEEFDREASLMSRGQRIPGDATTDILRDIRSGVDIEEVDGSEPEPEPPTPSSIALDVVSKPAQPSKPHPNIPVEILDVLDSPERAELLEVAKMLRRSQDSMHTMIFRTPIGDIKCPVNWMSCRPIDINDDSMFFVKTRPNSLAFIPKPGAVFDIAFEGMRGEARVVCLAPPQRLYPGVDLLCFMPHTPFMEKTGQLKEGAPSVVSGDPSTKIVDGEPVADGERPISKSAFATGQLSRDFDIPRPL